MVALRKKNRLEREKSNASEFRRVSLPQTLIHRVGKHETAPGHFATSVSRPAADAVEAAVPLGVALFCVVLGFSVAGLEGPLPYVVLRLCA